jgi:hypothetical protein
MKETHFQEEVLGAKRNSPPQPDFEEYTCYSAMRG